MKKTYIWRQKSLASTSKRVLAVCAGRGVKGASKESAEIERIGKADGFGDLRDAERGLLEKVGGDGQTIVIEIGDGGDPELLFEAAVKIGLRKIRHCGKRRDRERLLVVRVQVIDHTQKRAVADLFFGRADLKQQLDDAIIQAHSQAGIVLMCEELVEQRVHCLLLRIGDERGELQKMLQAVFLIHGDVQKDPTVLHFAACGIVVVRDVLCDL